MNDPALIWSYLASQPLLWLTATLAVSAFADTLAAEVNLSSADSAGATGFARADGPTGR